MKIESNFRVQLADLNGSPIRIERVIVDALLYVSGKQRYRFDAGSTDIRGSLMISSEELERSRVSQHASRGLRPSNRCSDSVGERAFAKN